MKVAVAGAGAVGRSVTRELIGNGHDVTLVERNPEHVDVDAIPAAHWRLGDACELSLLQSVHLEDFDVVVAATGDIDLANVNEFSEVLDRAAASSDAITVDLSDVTYCDSAAVRALLS